MVASFTHKRYSPLIVKTCTTQRIGIQSAQIKGILK
jgi:hypothetical protein